MITLRGLALSLVLALGSQLSGCSRTPVVVQAPAAAQAPDKLVTLWPDPPPAAPNVASLVDYFSPPTSRNQFKLDTSSLASPDSQVVRFSTVIESESGARNVRHEAINCDSRERRLLATGRPDGSWSVSSTGAWQPIGEGAANQGHAELYRALCFGGATVNGAQVADRLRAEGRQRGF